MLREAKNNVTICGILSEVDLKESTFIKNGARAESIGGQIKVRVNQVINDVPTTLEIPVYMFAPKFKNDGGPNPAYDSIMRVKNDYISIAASNEASADCVRITSAKVVMNEYYGRNGSLVSFPRISTSFVTRIKREEMKPEASFSTEICVMAKNPELNRNGEETGRYIITAAVPQYGGKVDVMNFVCINPAVINGVSQYWTEGDTFEAKGRLNFSSRVETVVQEVDFGEPIEKSRTISVSELVITGGTQTPLDGAFAFEHDEIQRGLSERKARLEATKEKQAAPKPTVSTAASKSFDLGF